MVINDYPSALRYSEVQDIQKTLQSGGLVLFPSDTVWAVGCDATQPSAIERLYALKNRTHQHPFILLVDSVEMLKEFVGHVHPRIETLLYFHNRPLTVIYDEPVNLPLEALAADGTVAIRVIQDDFCRSFIKELGRPIVATTACREPGSVPHHFGEIQSDILEGVDWVSKHRQKERHFEELSVIARLDAQEELEFIRE
ncbi:MAG: Sua5/YciO/YrdC/YwlC family protein [Saprospirales bacterium]|nr:Sua5/YciO/YrdC/YwlC family protein [Saprospirales bacterium]MBK8490316.1 Sua5/YciO/YrdC/YwlC family protein [Saprospirales bacterium]